MRSAALLAVAAPVATALVVAGCGGGPAKPVASPTPSPPSIDGAGARAIGEKTVAAGTARFTLTITGAIGGANISADERGALAFTRQEAHIYKLLLSGGIPQEQIIDGPFEYANGDVEAAMNDPSVKAWTKLDTRRLTAKQRLSSENELAHVRAPAYLIDGVAHAVRIGTSRGTTHLRGTVDPALLATRLPVALRESIVVAVRNDYADKAFPADFWVDSNDRVRRVHVSYRTPGGGRITLNATYYDYGAAVPLKLPPARGTQVITP